PKLLAGMTVQYANGPFLATLSNKFTGLRYSSLVNDEAVPGFHLTDLALGYRLPNTQWIKNVTLRLNVSNLLDKNYLVLSAGSGSSFVRNARPIAGVTTGSGAVFYYVGAPRFTSASVTMDF
ncbi:MAG: TonB-dependent receptor, partial [Burkholderiales bacterium]|nr:TonB-dependent receptor [Burkholderiales bacterium]